MTSDPLPLKNRLKIDRKWLIFSVVALTIIMATLDASIVNIALPIIRADFKVDITQVEWVVVAYMLTIISLLMISGRAADIYGQKKIYILGIHVFTLGSLLCAMAENISQLILFRSFQGCGAACSMANGNVIIASVFPPKERGKALGLIGSCVAVGLSAGPILGGVITTYFGWRWIFLFNLPLGVIAALCARIYLLEKASDRESKFDFLGAIFLSISLISLMLSLTKYHEWGLTAAGVLFLTSIVFFTVFIATEKRLGAPMVDLKLFHDDRFSSANLAAFLNFAARFSITFLLPFYLIDLRGITPSAAGLLMTPVPVLFALMSPSAGALSDRIGSRLLTTLGMLVTTFGFILLVFINENSSLLFILICLIINGIGGGLFNSPNINTIMGCVPPKRLGNAGAMSALVRNLGMVVGIAWSGALFAAIRGHNLGFTESLPRIVPAFQAAMAAAALSLVAAYVSYRRSEITLHR